MLKIVMGRFLRSEGGTPGLQGEDRATPVTQDSGLPAPAMRDASDKAKRRGSDYKAGIYRNMKTCVFSLRPFSPLLLPSLSASLLSLNAERLEIYVCVTTYTHVMSSCLSF